MKVKTWIPLALAVVLGLVAAKLVRDSIVKGRTKTEDTKFVATVVAAHDIEPGAKLNATDLTVGKVSADAVPSGAFDSVEKLHDRVTTTRLVKGQPVFESLLAPEGTAAGVQALIPEGMRAITLQVNEFSGLAGMLVPGCKVDVVTVIKADDGKNNMSRTIVQNVEVRAVGRTVSAAAAAAAAEPQPGSPPPAIPTSVTLLVTPQQAEEVQLASYGGTPWLVLRNASDEDPVESEGTSLADLRGDKSKTPFSDDVTPPTKLTSTSTGSKTDPFADSGDSKPVSSRSAGTRMVKIIRATKEESVTVDVPQAPPSSVISTKADAGNATEE